MDLPRPDDRPDDDEAGARATELHVEGGSAQLPDPEDAARAADLLPEDPTPAAAEADDPGRKAAVRAPVPAHGESASAEQLAEGDRAERIADRDLDR